MLRLSENILELASRRSWTIDGSNIARFDARFFVYT
jgi:hypothetical protein